MREGESVKLFIGQVPRDWTDKDLRGIFEQYGEVSSLKMLTDKETGQPKGCAFLTFADNEAAKTAQQELHEKKTLPGARNPLQVKPAASEVKDEYRKLYVGMLSRKLSEDDITSMFSPYGAIEDVTILKNADGKSRGCAFIKYETRQQAHSAIRALHNSETMEGCSYPLVVKIADTDKDKLNKKRMYQQQQHNQGVPNMHSGGQQHHHHMGAPNVGAASVLSGGTAQLQQQLLAQMALPQYVTANPNYIAATPVAAAPGTMSALVAAMAYQQQQLQPQQQLQTQVQAVNQQPLHSDPQSHVNSSLYSAAQLPSYSIPQVSSNLGSSISGLGTALGGISTLQNPLGGTLQSQLGSSLQSQLGSSLQSQLGSSLQSQLGGSLQSQLGGSLQSQLGGSLQSQLGGSLQSQLGSSLQSQLGGSLQSQLGGSLQSQLGTSLQSQLGGALQSQLGGSLQNPLVASTQLAAAPSAGTALSAYSVGGLGGYATVGTGGSAVGSTGYADNTLQQAYSGVQQYVTSYPQAYSSNVRSSSGLQQQQQQNSVRKDGPDGANLFIYQIPSEFNDTDLMHTFAPFGNVVSAKVFVDKGTGLSKGFGFVSYDNANSANAAINSMNGVAIGSKRLRVQHKRPKEHGKPY